MLGCKYQITKPNQTNQIIHTHTHAFIREKKKMRKANLPSSEFPRDAVRMDLVHLVENIDTFTERKVVCMFVTLTPEYCGHSVRGDTKRSQCR